MAKRGSDDPHENREVERIRDKARYEEGAAKGVQSRGNSKREDKSK